LEELTNSSEKQQFALMGTKVHEHREGERCAFCGNEITLERWKKLDSYFDKSIQTLETRIKNGLSYLDSIKNKVGALRLLDSGDFYENYSEDIVDINRKIEVSKANVASFIDNLELALRDKQRNLFNDCERKLPELPIEYFSEINNRIDKIVRENNDTTNNLLARREESRKLLRYDAIAEMLAEFNYEVIVGQRNECENQFNKRAEEIGEKKRRRDELRDEKRDLREQMKNEKLIANKINDKLKSIGANSFKLELVEESNGEKGQYKIRGSDNELRSIEKLSKGELNIVAFLYFLYSLEKLDNTKVPIIIFDDPMTSNDDTMQYLMISELMDFYIDFKNKHNQRKDGFLIIATHNCQFFLNVRPNVLGLRHDSEEMRNYYSKNSYYYFASDGQNTDIMRIKKKEDDFSNNYELLWQELRYLYDNNKPTLMLSPARKICETYCGFNRINSNSFYSKNGAARKLFNTNQHSPFDIDAEQNGRAREQVIAILRNIFKDNLASEHFEKCWSC